MQQQERGQQHQAPPQQQQLPLGLDGQPPSSEAMEALYQQLGMSAPQGLPLQAPHQLMDPAFGQQVRLAPDLTSLGSIAGPVSVFH